MAIVGLSQFKINKIHIFCILCFLPFALTDEYDDIETRNSTVRYDGYSVIRIIPSNNEELKFIQGFREDLELDFWILPGMINRRVDIMIPPWKIQKIKLDLENLKMNFSVLIEDVQKLIDEERKYMDHQRNRRSIPLPWGRSFFKTYYESKYIYEYLEYLNNRYSSLMTTENIGITYQGRLLQLAKIGTKSELTKPIIWIDGGIHAREWISPATAIYFIHKLLKEYRSNANITHLLETYDFYIMPLVNPDGYDYTHDLKGDRQWRKNLSKSPKHKDGVDLNRNFRYCWNNDLTSPINRNQYAETYRGPFAMSERESQAIERVLLPVKKRVKLFLSLHSNNQFILFPWGCKYENVENYKELNAISMRAARAIETAFGTRYTTGSTIEMLYSATGTSIDWAYGELGIKYAFVFRLRDIGSQGYNLNRNYIVHVGEETWRGVQSIIHDITAN